MKICGSCEYQICQSMKVGLIYGLIYGLEAEMVSGGWSEEADQEEDCLEGFSRESNA